MNELPELSTSNYASNTLLMGQAHPLIGAQQDPLWQQELLRRVVIKDDPKHIQQPPKEKPVSMRIVQIFIADPDENVPLDKRVLYTGPQQLTDLTDQELFFEVSIQSILADHNAVRTKLVDKKASDKFGRDVFLLPVRIRDLKMVVVDIARF